MTETGGLSDKSRAILGMIAEGFSYAQIVDGHGFTYLEIAAAAKEALRLSGQPGDYQKRLADIRAKHPRAYEPWSEQEDAELKAMFSSGEKHRAMADHFKRQSSAIQSRLRKLGLEQKE